MRNMYDSNVDADFYNISLDGYDMIMEEFTPNESFNRRETIRHNILGGTQSVMRGNYLPRDFSFTTHFLISPENPDIYDEIIRVWQSRPVEVISKYMGGKFKAEVIIKKSPTQQSPNYLAMEIQVIEIPDEKSLIPKDEFIIPKDVTSSITVSSTKKKTKSKSKNKSSSKNKNSKKDSKQKKKDKKKGKNITKAKKNGKK